MLHKSTITKINDWQTWWNYHADKVDTYPLPQKVQWLLKATNGAFDIISDLAREVNRINDGRRQLHSSDGGIILPAHIRWPGK